MLTLEKIKKDFSYIQSSGGYHSSETIEKNGNNCDVYFECNDKKLNQKQVDTYNSFLEKLDDYKSKIERYITDSLNQTEDANTNPIMDVIEVPFANTKYDLVLICGKTRPIFILFKKEIGVRVEFRNGKIKSICLKSDIFEDND